MTAGAFPKHIRYSILIALFCSGLTSSLAQNLVKNPSFEDLVECPNAYGSFNDSVLFWTCPTNGSTDYFNSCSKQMGIDRNFAGGQKAFDGRGYAGFYAFGPKDYREYIGGEIRVQLQKGKKYLVSAMVSLSDKSAYAVDELGFLFTKSPITLQITRNIPHKIMVSRGLSNYMEAKNKKFYTSKLEWMKVEGEYTANGTERFITFGNFKQNRKTGIISIDKNMKKAAYYFVDLVTVKELNKSFDLDEVYVFDGLNFDTNGFQIKVELEAQLQPLIQHLKDHPTLNVAIFGHTDNLGDSTYNTKLSEKRAKSVGLFFVEHGISPFRIAWQGYGDAKPIMPNQTEEGRERNRRVEFIVSEKKREFYASGLFEDTYDN